MNKLTLILTIILFSFSLCAVENHSTEISYNDVAVMIRFSEPKIFKINDSIYIDIEIKNKSNKPSAVLIADDKRYTFDFELVSLQNKPVGYNKDYSNFFNRVQPIFNSMIRLNKDEGFTYRVLLNDYYDIDTSGQYYIRAVFHPALKLSENNVNVMKSNYLTINVRPESINDRYIVEQKEAEMERMLFAEKKAPDEVIEYMLNARMKSEWEKYFLYIDVSKMILTNSKFKDKYRKADSERQSKIIEEYKEYLKQNTIDEMSYIPILFNIVKTEYSTGEAKVEAILKFKQYDFIEDKYYTYFLNKKDDKWFVTSYTVLNIGAR
ncbi:MAG: hypothetical protein A2015_06700 [Spirochaetes bacterium GWF1_31_7]|nr:MAG: hypothetical protein A2Y30_09765 [Spirochaetes bacterium GWE1_32_154]OHD46527.1 MAG: hypothetical protein A2015_06700 [Spirochaetes bacterium GWF1_31_7]OHD49336.1 MAG: hypothetical protein A2Y29_03690 [Spirochaetes bacterium GWE2_31_10]HBD93542.1 hypothetical protein [Spirochaetia bacterium]HBI36808.1 hypothetical protein [Spirochaetia bacterium]